MLATCNTQNAHLWIVAQAGEEFGCDEEVLACVLTAGDLDHALVDHALVARIHTLIDLVYNAERRLRHRLESHQVENSRDRTLAAGLAVRGELLKSFIFTKRVLV